MASGLERLMAQSLSLVPYLKRFFGVAIEALFFRYIQA
jgi:hypothetical protein